MSAFKARILLSHVDACARLIQACARVQEEKIERVVEFLEKPHRASDKDLAAKVSSTGTGTHQQ